MQKFCVSISSEVHSHFIYKFNGGRNSALLILIDVHFKPLHVHIHEPVAMQNFSAAIHITPLKKMKDFCISYASVNSSSAHPPPPPGLTPGH